MYRWVDDEGVLHITDDFSNVPAKYWERGVVKKQETPSAASDTVRQPAQPEAAGQPLGEKADIYGDQPIEWWKSKFEELKAGITDIEGRLEKARNYLTIYEGGRRYGKIYTAEETSQYEGYKNEIGSLEEKLNSLKSEQAELQRKAAVYGVPRNIRE